MRNIRNLRVEKVPGYEPPQPALYLVKNGDEIIGQMEKYRNTRYETHPWKAFLGTGHDREYVGAFYGKNGKDLALGFILGHYDRKG